MENSNLIITTALKSDLSETARWGKFMAIVGFVSVGFLLLLAFSLIFAGDISKQMSGVSGAVVSFFYFIVAIIYLFPVVFLFRYSNEMKRALEGDDQQKLEAAFGNLKKIFVFFGVVTAITLLFYVLAIIAMAVGGIIGNTI